MKPFAFLTHIILAIGGVYFETPKSQTFSLSNLSTSFFLYFLEWENAQESDLAHFLIIEHFFEFKPQQNLSFDISTFTITLILEFMSIIPFQFIVKPFGDNFSWSPSTTFLI